MGLHLIAAGGFWTNPYSYLYIFEVCVGLGVVIFVHELGHFLVAKACGVKAEKFYLGFDMPMPKIGPFQIPSRIFRFQWGETEYGIGIIPLGGYVKLYGMDDNPAKAAEAAAEARISHSDAPVDKDAGGEDKTKTAAEGSSAEEYPDTDTSESKAPPSGDDGGDVALDPRSYQAKPVPSRMAIISAGVIMNLIFAVIFASIAFPLGVLYEPTEIRGTVPSGPAWEAGLQPGDKIIQIGKDGRRDEHLRFTRDLRQAVFFTGSGNEMDLLVRRGQTGREEWVKLIPRVLNENAKMKFPQIGVIPNLDVVLAAENPVLPHLSAAKVTRSVDGRKAKFEPSDRIIAINGKPIHGFYELRSMIVQNVDKPLDFTVKRKETGKEITLRVEPNPTRRIGLRMKIGKIMAIQNDSPAAKAGFKKGDLIVSVDGEPVDPFTLGPILRRVAEASSQDDDQSLVDVDVKRNGKTVTLKVRPRMPLSPPVYMHDLPIAIDELGLAFPVLNVVAAVEPGSSAAKMGLKKGDKIVQVKLKPANAKKKELEKERLGIDHSKPIDLDEHPRDWPVVHETMQVCLPDTKLLIKYERGGKTRDKAVTVSLSTSKQWFNETRGIRPILKQDTRYAHSFGEAVQLGVRQTYEDMFQVLYFLKKLVTGQISVTLLGGPGTIAYAATAEASQGIPRLLLFLTLLSANLAIVNFLPIPVLDGGHMMFLSYELVFRKPLSEKWYYGLSYMGFFFIIGLMLFVVGLDVWRFT